MAYTFSKLAMIKAINRYILSRFICCGVIMMDFILYELIDLTRGSISSIHFIFP